MVCIPAYAEDRAGERDRAGGGRGAGFFLRGADKDGDGAVSFREFSALERIANLPEEKRKALFARLDKDGDGFIRRDELPKPPPGNGDRPPLALRQLDTNGDGAVDYEEFLEAPFVKRMPEERRRPFFDRLDRNGDGKVSPEDRPRGGGRDGRGRPERPGRPDLQGLFPRLDANGDGSLDFEEFRKAPGIDQMGEDAQEDRFEKIDKNGDLKLDRSELSEARPMPERGRGPRDGKPDRRPKGRPDAPERGPKDGPDAPERPGEDAPMMKEGA